MLDIDQFRRWAMGDIVDNLTRGLFAEWLVGQALGVIDSPARREEWAPYDWTYGKLKVEVKASGRSQGWKPDKETIPRFGIATSTGIWKKDDQDEYVWTKFKTPRRVADVYVFCLHEPVPAKNENVADLNSWTFWAVATRVLNAKLGAQKTMGLAKLNELANPVTWSEIRKAVDDIAALADTANSDDNAA